MTTLERPHDTIDTSTREAPRRRSLFVALALVLALVLAGFVGWSVRGSDTADTEAVVVVDRDELTDRQNEMVDLLGRYEAAWQDKDLAVLEAMFVPNGTFTAFGTDYGIDDGTFVDYVGRGSWSSLDVLEPVLVNGDGLLNFHRLSGETYMNAVQFTTDGELLIVSHEVID